jgi:hypothetical protein
MHDYLCFERGLQNRMEYHQYLNNPPDIQLLQHQRSNRDHWGRKKVLNNPEP